MILLQSTDKIQVITSAAITCDVVAAFLDMSMGDPPVVKGSTSGKQVTAITTATTTDVVAAPAALHLRSIKYLGIRNKHATSSVDITVQINVSATLYELHKVTLRAGETLEFVDNLGFYVITATRKLFANLRVGADVVNATTSFADVTGLTAAVESGKHYNFEAHLFHMANATTTGAFFAINGPTMTAMRLLLLDVVTANVAAAAMGSNTADITARDTNVSIETTSAITPILAILSGWINPSAAGTFAIRFASEVAVAAGITVKQGSWLQIWEADN